MHNFLRLHFQFWYLMCKSFDFYTEIIVSSISNDFASLLFAFYIFNLHIEYHGKHFKYKLR